MMAIQEQVKLLQQITSPYAKTSDHVQGPGGNTSIKEDGKILIKASGFTFNDIANGTGVVLLDNTAIVENLKALKSLEDIVENKAPNIIESIPSGLKPSMEFEFHSLLNKYVLHTHSVYVNIVVCTSEAEELLSTIFKQDEYLLVKYVTPGFPIAAELLKNDSQEIPSIIFLKNHGIIIHGDDAAYVNERYQYVEDTIKRYFNLSPMPELHAELKGDETIIKGENIYSSNLDFNAMENDLMGKILIPDQSIFFKNKLSVNVDDKKEIYLDINERLVVINGSDKFIKSAKSMLQAVYYIKENMLKLGLQPDYIPKEKLDIIHGLTTEKYRLSILNNNQ